MNTSAADAARSPAPIVKGGAERSDAIDALRGIAFLGVLLVHAGQAVPDFAGNTFTAFGGYGVALFFIASAFTLLMSHHQRRAGENRPVLSFFIRRVFRIVPLFWAGIVFYFVLYGSWNRGWAEGSLGVFHFGLTALQLHGFHPDTINSVVPGGWSIAAEFFFYLLCPLLFIVITTWRRALAGYVLFLAAALILNFFARGDAGFIAHLFPGVPAWRQNAFTFFWLPSHFPTFFLGFLAFFIVRRRRAVPPARLRGALIASCLALVAAVLWLPLSAADLLMPPLLAGFVIALILRPSAFFVNRLTCSLGVVSFSAYIVHFAAIKAVAPLIGKLSLQSSSLRFAAVFLASLALTATAAAITYRLIELPGVALGRQFIKRLRAPRPHSLPHLASSQEPLV